MRFFISPTHDYEDFAVGWESAGLQPEDVALSPAAFEVNGATFADIERLVQLPARNISESFCSIVKKSASTENLALSN